MWYDEDWITMAGWGGGEEEKVILDSSSSPMMENDTGWGQGGRCWISLCGRNRQSGESDAQQWRSPWMGPRARAVTPPVGTKGQPWFTCRLLLLVAAINESLEPCKQAHMLASEGSQEVDYGCVFWHQKEQRPKSQSTHTKTSSSSSEPELWLPFALLSAIIKNSQ